MPNVAFRMANVIAVKPELNILVTDRGEFHYDQLVIATGSTTNFFGNKEIAREAMQLKTVAQALDIRSDFLQDFEAALYLDDEHDRRRQLNFVIVGGGPTGVELAGALAEIRMTILKKEYREMESEHMQIHLVDSNTSLLNNFSKKAQEKAFEYLTEMGVSVRFGMRVIGCDENTIKFADGSTMATNTLIWAAGVKGVCIPGLESAFNAKADRFNVDEFSRLNGFGNIYAVGDVALNMTESAWLRGHPQVAPAAIQQAKNLAKNLLKDPSQWTPFKYNDKGSMATIGRFKAVMDRGKLHLSGPIAWFSWIFIHVMSLVSFRNRMLVLFNLSLIHISEPTRPY